MPLPFESGRKIDNIRKRIPEDTKQRAVPLVLDHRDEYPNLTVACQTAAGRLGIGAEPLLRWVRHAQTDTSDHHGVSLSESERTRTLQRENRELREANAILKETAFFLAGELDPDAVDRRLYLRTAGQGHIGAYAKLLDMSLDELLTATREGPEDAVALNRATKDLIAATESAADALELIRSIRNRDARGLTLDRIDFKLRRIRVDRQWPQLAPSTPSSLPRRPTRTTALSRSLSPWSQPC